MAAILDVVLVSERSRPGSTRAADQALTVRHNKPIDQPIVASGEKCLSANDSPTVPRSNQIQVQKPKRKRIVIRKPSSNYCRTCRERKVKCDEGRPSCYRCIKAGRQCRYGSWDVPIEEKRQAPTPPTGQTSVVVALSPSISEQAVNQVHVLSDFLSSYYPKADLAAPAPIHANRMSLLHFMISNDVAAPMINSAIDTLCLAHLATKSKDDSIVHASRDSYGRLLSLLQRAITYSKAERPLCHHREIISTILVMSLMPIATENGIAKEEKHHSIHTVGAAQYIQAHGPSVFGERRPLDLILLQSIHLRTALEGIVRRKAVLWDSIGWRELDDVFINNISARIMTDFNVPLPGVLERCDAFVSCSSPDPKAAAFGQEYNFLIKRFHELTRLVSPWIENISTISRTEVHCSETNMFDLEIEEQCFMFSSQTFTSFYDFKKPDQAFTIAYMRLVCLVAECALLQVLYHGRRNGLASETHIPDVECRAFRHAHELCRHTYFFSKRPSISSARFLCVLLRCVRNYFESYGALREMGWCQACLIATEIRIERMSTTATPTLCRVAEAMRELPEACRYRMG